MQFGSYYAGNFSKDRIATQLFPPSADFQTCPPAPVRYTILVGLSHKHEVALEKSADFPTRYELPLDGDKIRQVLANLLSNAAKYSKKGGKVTVDFKDMRTENKVLITVKDTGLGIPAKQQSRMFEKFFRADNVQTADTEGTGLGLYIAKAIIEGHGGKMWFESEENVGTTFFIELPTNN